MGVSVRAREMMNSKRHFTQSGFLLQSFGKNKANSADSSGRMKERRVKTVVDTMST